MNDLKYSWLELMFCDRWQWVRKKAKVLWVKDKRPGYMWVKFSNNEIDYFFDGKIDQFYNEKEYFIEDWRA